MAWGKTLHPKNWGTWDKIPLLHLTSIRAHGFRFRFVNKTWGRLRTIIYLLYLCILCCLSYSACVVIVMFIPSNVNVPVAEILWKFSFWWYFDYCQLHSVASIPSCPLHGNYAVDTVKCYFCFSCSFYEMYVSIVNIYQSFLVSLFFRHFNLSISASIQLVTELGQHSCVDKLHYIVTMIYNPWTFLFHPFQPLYVLK